MISFELKKPGAAKTVDELEVFLDRAGLDSLLAQFQFLKDGRTEHAHLMAESWGGSELSDSPQRQENAVRRSTGSPGTRMRMMWRSSTCVDASTIRTLGASSQLIQQLEMRTRKR
jgi:hypothetical protein